MSKIWSVFVTSDEFTAPFSNLEMCKKDPFLRQEPTSSSDKPKRGKNIATDLLKYR